MDDALNRAWEPDRRGAKGGTDLEELESFGLQSLRGQSGERRAQTLLTEAQGLTGPHGAVWKHTHTDKKTHAGKRTDGASDESTADTSSHTRRRLVNTVCSVD